MFTVSAVACVNWNEWLNIKSTHWVFDAWNENGKSEWKKNQRIRWRWWTECSDCSYWGDQNECNAKSIANWGPVLCAIRVDTRDRPTIRHMVDSSDVCRAVTARVRHTVHTVLTCIRYVCRVDSQASHRPNFFLYLHFYQFATRECILVRNELPLMCRCLWSNRRTQLQWSLSEMAV